MKINPFPHTTILQHMTLNIFCQKIENLYNWMDNQRLKVENIVAKGEITRFEQFLLLSLCLLQRRQKACIWGKGFIPTVIQRIVEGHYKKPNLTAFASSIDQDQTAFHAVWSWSAQFAIILLLPQFFQKWSAADASKCICMQESVNILNNQNFLTIHPKW